MKYILLITLILVSASLLGISQGALLFLSFEPSSINRAMGGDVTGVVNIWHNNPLTANANPAVAAFHEGISWGYTRDEWGTNSGIDDMEYNASLFNIGYRGLALTLPGNNASDRWGITFDGGLQNQFDGQGNIIGEFRSLDHAKIVGGAINPFAVTRGILNYKAPWMQYIDLAVGANFLDTHSFLAPGTGMTEQAAEADVRTTNLGGVARLNYCFGQTFALEAVYGLSHFNGSITEVSYIDSEQADRVYNHRNQGFALAGSIKADKLLGTHLPEAAMFFTNLVTLRYLNGSKDPMYNKDEKITGWGTELGLLDTFFIRNGYYDDEAGQISGKTSGWGLNMHFRDLFSFSYNKSTTPGGDLFGTETSEDYGLSLDFISLGKAVFK